jgi:peptidoglycan hydrolase-like amidase
VLDTRIRLRRTLPLLTVAAVLAVLVPGAPASATTGQPASDALATDEGTATVAQTAPGTLTATVTGRGFGHGRGMGQYGALGYATDKRWNRDQILSHFYGDTTAGWVPDNPMSVRLMAQDGRPTTVAVGGGNGVSISFDGGTTWIYTGAPAVRLSVNGAGWWFEPLAGCNGPAYTEAPLPTESSPMVRIRPAATDGGLLPADDPNAPDTHNLHLCTGSTSTTVYRGELRAVNDKGVQRTVNVLPTELYLRGVVPREMPASWGALDGGAGQAALESQAVSARSYATAQNRWSYAKTCDTTSCQVYAGRAVTVNGAVTVREQSSTNAAIAATAGLVRMRNGAVLATEYSSSTGGMTAGGTFPVVPDDGDATSRNPNRTWTASLSVAAIEQKYGRSGLQGIEVTERTGIGADGGRVRKLRLTFGDGAPLERTGNQFRSDFGLKSDWFSVAYTPPATEPPAGSAPVSIPIATGYTAQELPYVTAAAAKLKITPEEFQRTAIWVTGFLVGLSGRPGLVTPISPPPRVDGPNVLTTVYQDADIPAFWTVMQRFAVGAPEAQKVATTLLVYLVGA